MTSEPHAATTGLPPPGEPMLTEAEAAAILSTAHTVIAGIGIEVPDDRQRESVLRRWGRANGRRITFPPDEVNAYLAEWRERNGFGEPGYHSETPWPLSSDTVLGLSVMPYSHTYLDPRSDQHLPLTASRLIEATRFLGTLRDDAVDATVPGHPVDVPPALQPLVEYKTGAQYNPQGGGYGWTGAPATAEHLFRMAELMGRPITTAVVYVFSPLRLGGAELETAMAFRDSLRAVHVSNMGACGGSFPLNPKTALALSWAETIAGAMCVAALTDLPTNWGGSVEPFDLRAQTIPFGAPEQTLLYRLSRDAGCWIRGGRPAGGHAPLLTMAKRPGAQAALEKTAAATLAVASGWTSLGAAGSLSADEVFSPTQVLLDMELRDWLQRVCQGVGFAPNAPDDAVRTIREGLERGSFTTSDETLDHYRQLYWFPKHLRRGMLARWQALGRPDAVDSARREAIERIEGATWVLPEPQFSELEDIYEQARRSLSS